MDVYFISEEALKANSLINENVDNKVLLPTLITVQDIYLQKILGTPMYEDLKTKIAGGTLSNDEKELIKNYIHKVLINYMMMMAPSVLKYHYMNKGVMVKSGENSQSAERIDMTAIKDEWRIIAEEYAELLTRFLKKKTTLFPKYVERTETGMNPIKSNYTTGIDLEGDDFDC